MPRTIRKVTALAGGVGGARLVEGLARVLPPGALTVIGNTGDDFRHYGLAVSPDLDTVMYTLAGIAHPQNGWGLKDDTRAMLEMLKRYGEEGWFGIGDQDMATNLLRTAWLAEGKPLSTITAELCHRLGVQTRLLPMTDDPLHTMVETVERGVLAFQEYFVRHRWQPTVKALHYRGAERATAAPGVLESIQRADLLVICPSNPVLSIEPILQVAPIRRALADRQVPCVAFSPIIAGDAVKGPTVKIMRELSLDPSLTGISRYYAGLIDGFMVDTQDMQVEVTVPKYAANIWLDTSSKRETAAAELLAWSESL